MTGYCKGLIRWLAQVSGALLILINVSFAEFQELCLRDKFTTKCPEGHVIVMHTAEFGRMRIGKCARTNFGYIPCSNNVMHIVDQECSGRRECFLDVFKTFREMKPCGEVESYLELNFTCLQVSDSTVTTCGKAHYATLTRPVGYISSYDISRLTSTYGHQSCRYLLAASPGQTWNFTLFDFGVDRPYTVQHNSGKNIYTHICARYAIINEPSQPNSKGTVVCGGDTRERTVYLSKSHRVFIDVYDSANEAAAKQFIIRYQVAGCTDPQFTGVQMIKRDGDMAWMKCNASSVTYQLRCKDSRWEGTHAECAMGLLLVTGIGIALGVVVGILLLTVAVACYKRQHRSHQTIDRDHQPLKSKFDIPPMQALPSDIDYRRASGPYAEYSVPGTPRPIPTQPSTPKPLLSSGTGPGTTDSTQAYEQNFLIKLRDEVDRDLFTSPENGMETFQLKSRASHQQNLLQTTSDCKSGRKAVMLSFLGENEDHVYEIPE